jgi:site-specific DNA-cytosine methylase
MWSATRSDQYCFTPPGFALSPGGILVPESTVPAKIAIDLFCGCDGFSLGIQSAGMDVAIALDHDIMALCSYVWNLGAPDGRPCQGFSKAGKQDPADARNNLILEFLRVVIETDADSFAMENVPPLLLQDKFRPLRDTFFDRANAAGYNITADVLDAVNYGVPQHRRRAFVLGIKEGRGGVPMFPRPTHWGLIRAADRTKNTDMLEDTVPGKKREEEDNEMDQRERRELLATVWAAVGDTDRSHKTKLTKFERGLVGLLLRAYNGQPVHVLDLAIAFCGEEEVKRLKGKSGDPVRIVRNAVRRPIQMGRLHRGRPGYVAARPIKE